MGRSLKPELKKPSPLRLHYLEIQVFTPTSFCATKQEAKWGPTGHLGTVAPWWCKLECPDWHYKGDETSGTKNNVFVRSIVERRLRGASIIRYSLASFSFRVCFPLRPSMACSSSWTSISFFTGRNIKGLRVKLLQRAHRPS